MMSISYTQQEELYKLVKDNVCYICSALHPEVPNAAEYIAIQSSIKNILDGIYSVFKLPTEGE